MTVPVASVARSINDNCTTVTHHRTNKHTGANECEDVFEDIQGFQWFNPCVLGSLSSDQLTNFGAFGNERRHLGLTPLQHICQTPLSYLVNGGIKPEHLEGHRVTFPQLVERCQLTQIEGPTVILAINLKIKLNQKVTLIMPFPLWLISMVVFLMKLTIRFFFGQYAVHLYTVLPQQGLAVEVAGARVSRDDSKHNQPSAHQCEETSRNHGTPVAKVDVENATTRSGGDYSYAQHR